MPTPHLSGLINQPPVDDGGRYATSHSGVRALWVRALWVTVGAKIRAKMRPEWAGFAGRVLLVMLLIGCATPAHRFDHTATQFGLQGNILKGKDFFHQVYRNHATGPRVHVYLDGDGTPWLTRFVVATDPTPRNPLVLQWLVQDTAPSWYVGRPCYHGVQTGCEWTWWTDRRYSLEVVASMTAVVQHIMQAYQSLVLIGYSGGGTLAMLLAEHLPTTQAVVTVAGNLDVSAWTDWHGYSPLNGSLNPAHRPALPSAIIQHHWAGGQDRVVPAWIVAQGMRAQPTAHWHLVEDYDHHCCWQRHWPNLLQQLEAALAKQR